MLKKLENVEGNLSKKSHQTLENQKPIFFIFSFLEKRLFLEIFDNSKFYPLHSNFKKISVLKTTVITI